MRGDGAADGFAKLPSLLSTNKIKSGRLSDLRAMNVAHQCNITTRVTKFWHFPACLEEGRCATYPHLHLRSVVLEDSPKRFFSFSFSSTSGCSPPPPPRLEPK